jgi:hypothetical protein
MYLMSTGKTTMKYVLASTLIHEYFSLKPFYTFAYITLSFHGTSNQPLDTNYIYLIVD